MLRLPIYERGQIVKVHEVHDFIIPYGVIQDVLRIIEPEKLNDNVALTGMVIAAFEQVNILLLELFPEITEEELRHTDLGDIVVVFSGIAKYAVEKLTAGLNLKKGVF